MTLGELIKSVSWSEVRASLLWNHPAERERVEEYAPVLGRLKSLLPRATAMVVGLEVVMDEEGKERIGVDVYGWRRGTGGSGAGERGNGGSAAAESDGSEVKWALEYQPWDEWLGMEIEERTLEVFAPADVAAHCLWEMTFAGFDEETIRALVRELYARGEEFQLDEE